MIRRFGSAPKQNIQYQLRPGAYAILAKNRRVLLTLQAAPFNEFQLPGGGIDQGECIIPALRREVMEETGWNIGTPLRLGAFRRFVFMPEYDMWAEKICHIYLARPALKISAPTEAGHHCHWATPREAIGLVANSGDRHFLKFALNNIL